MDIEPGEPPSRFTIRFDCILPPMTQVTVIVEEHEDGFVAYPVGLKGVVVAQGDTYDEAVAEATSAIRFHVETFGDDVLEASSDIKDVRVTVADLAS